MELHNIEKLIEKYFDATTTVAEEETLKAFFAGDQVPDHLLSYAPMFQYFSEAKSERFTKQLPLKTSSLYTKWSAVAGVIVVSIGLYFGYQHQEQKKAVYAYEQTKKAFDLLAINLSKGTNKLVYLNEFEIAKEKIYKNN